MRLHSYVYSNLMFIKVIQKFNSYIYPYKPNKLAQLEVYHLYQCTHNILDTLMVVTFNVHRYDIEKNQYCL